MSTDKVLKGLQQMLNEILTKTSEFLKSMPKSKRKKKGQFFTSKETAVFMASLFDTERFGNEITVLDPGSGTGVLSAAFIERMGKESIVDKINLYCYETDEEVLPVLKENLKFMKEASPINLEYHVMEEDYLLSQYHDFNHDLLAEEYPRKYDAVIGNPPYLRVMRDNPAAMAMPEIVHGAPNMYFMFAAMSLFNLKDDAEMVYIIPRSWTSGVYFKAFRNYFLHYGKLEHIHLFVSRDKVFSQEQVLQETIIIKVRKTQVIPDSVKLTSSQSNGDFNAITELSLPYSAVVVGDEKYVFLPTSEEEVSVIQKLNQYDNTLPDIGLRMKTGIIVDFRQYDDLRAEPGENIVPLFYSQHIRNGRVNHNPSGKDFDWVITDKPGLIQKNKNYLFCKRFTAKEERRRLQCGIYLAKDFPDYKSIGTQNKINFVDHIDGHELSECEVYGIYVLLNSTWFDIYYRILNGSTQVNSTEVNNMPVPPLSTIQDMGRRLIKTDSLTTETCDRIMEAVYE